MAVTIQQIAQYLKDQDYKFKQREDKPIILLGMNMPTYRDPEGRDSLILCIELSENGEYFKLYAPKAFLASGKHLDVFLKACMVVQWRTLLVQFEYDPGDGEIRPVIEFPIEDGTLTAKQFNRCLMGMCQLMERYFGTLKRALDEGVLEFPKQQGGKTPHELLLELLGSLPPEEREKILRELQEKGGAPSEV